MVNINIQISTKILILYKQLSKYTSINTLILHKQLSKRKLDEALITAKDVKKVKGFINNLLVNFDVTSIMEIFGNSTRRS